MYLIHKIFFPTLSSPYLFSPTPPNPPSPSPGPSHKLDQASFGDKAIGSRIGPMRGPPPGRTNQRAASERFP